MRSERIRRAGKAVAFVAAASIGLATVVAHAGGGFEPAAPGEPTYVVTNVTVSQEMDAVLSSPQTLVSYDMAWLGNEFPGYAQCRAEVFDASGALIGAQDFERVSLLPSATRRTLEVPVGQGSAATANVLCGKAVRPPDSAGYEISEATVSGTEEDPRLLLSVKWTTDEPPLYQACTATFRRIDGSTATYEFGLSVGPGEAEVLLTPGFHDAVVLDVSCAPFTGTGA